MITISLFLILSCYCKIWLLNFSNGFNILKGHIIYSMLFHSDKRLKKVVLTAPSVLMSSWINFRVFDLERIFFILHYSLKRTELAVYLCHVHYSATYLTVTKKEISKSISNSQI